MRPPRNRLPAVPFVVSILATLAAAPVAAQEAQRPAGLPDFLVRVPAGKVQVGLEFDELWQICQDADIAPTNHKRNFEICATELGLRTVEVPEFYLGKTHVTNAEYLEFVKATGHRFPYHWWRYGQSEDYNARIKEMNQLFPDGGQRAPLDYWESNWKTKKLPYALKDARGKDISNYPVVFVSRRDALAYAAWVGMRLPHEDEWTRAARGDTEAKFIWGANQTAKDEYVRKDNATLKQLRLYARDAALKPVSTQGKMAQGPFGHDDMTGQVWEWTLTYIDYLSSRDTFEKQWKKKVMREADLRALPRPLLGDGEFVTKGTSYAAQEKPVSLHIDARIAFEPTQFFQLLGFRLAKSTSPARDLAISSTNAGFRRDLMRGKQSLIIDESLGMERYHIDEGRIVGYDGIVFVPVNFLTMTKNDKLKTFQEGIREKGAPAFIGTLVTSIPLKEPALPPGTYSVAYRPKGVTRAFATAVKDADKEVNKGREVKGSKWKSVLRRSGISEEDIKANKGKIEFVRVGGTSGLEVPIDKDILVFRDNDGNWVGSLALAATMAKFSKYKGQTMKLDESGDLPVLSMDIGVQLQLDEKKRDKNRHLFKFALGLDANPDAKRDAVPWVLSQEPDEKKAKDPKGPDQRNRAKAVNK